jgi:hypothetical protein
MRFYVNVDIVVEYDLNLFLVSRMLFTFLRNTSELNGFVM